MSKNPAEKESVADDLARRAEASEINVVRELFAFVRQEKKWFLVPILVILLLAGLFVVLSGAAVAPVIYTVF